MKILKISVFLSALLFLTACGEDTAEPVEPSEPKQARSGEEVFISNCSVCHISGAAGAPRLADKADWEKRLDERGRQGVINAAINGFRGMPPKGGCNDCMNEEVSNAVYYILAENALDVNGEEAVTE